MFHETTSHDDAIPESTIVAVFDSRMMALRAQTDLAAADHGEVWLGIVRGEDDDGATLVARENEATVRLHELLSERGLRDLDVHRFDGILPPGTAVMLLHAGAKSDQAIDIIEMIGGHIDHC